MKPEIQDELTRLQDQSENRLLTAKAVVAAAKNPKNPLHAWPGFIWDKGKAHEVLLLHQARHLIGEYVVVIERGDASVKTRHLVSLMSDRYTKGGGYRAVIDVLSDADLRAQYLADALRELNAIRERYSRLSELSKVFEEVARVEASTKTRKRKAGEARAA